MADYIEIGNTKDITNGTMKTVKIEGKDILLASVEGKYYSASAHCPHMKALLSKGKLNGTVVTCPMHGSQFDLKTGKVVRWVAGSGFMSLMGQLMSMIGMATKGEKPLAVYEVKVENDRIMIKLPK
jgi:3-phenylpropionate/trans-cinnamate dioxygenase ferredoxin subunit